MAADTRGRVPDTPQQAMQWLDEYMDSETKARLRMLFKGDYWQADADAVDFVWQTLVDNRLEHATRHCSRRLLASWHGASRNSERHEEADYRFKVSEAFPETFETSPQEWALRKV